MAQIRFLDDKKPSIKQSKPLGKKWRIRFILLLSIVVLENLYLVVNHYVK